MFNIEIKHTIIGTKSYKIRTKKEASKEGLKYLDYRSEMDSQDPPLYIYNPINSQDYINSEGTIDFNVLYHSFRHGDYLREKAIEVEQEFSGAYQESPEDFILRLLN